MKKFFITLLAVLMTVSVSAQVPRFNRIDFSKYETVDSLPLERIMIHFNKEIDNKDFVDLKSGYYLAPIPHKDNFVIKFNNDKSKAIVIWNSYCFGRHFEFNVKDEERRIVLWYKDDNNYCGYIYDKEFKVCKYFDSKRQFNKFMKHKPI